MVYTRDARRILMDIPDDAMKGIRSASEPYAQTAGRARSARAFRHRLGPFRDRRDRPDRQPLRRRRRPQLHGGSRVRRTRVITLETGSGDRLANMHSFAGAALNLLLQNLSK